jgi:hypothetical protein
MLKRFQIFKLNPVALLYFKKSMDNCKILEDFESSKHFQIAKGLNTNKNSFGKKGRKPSFPLSPGRSPSPALSFLSAAAQEAQAAPHHRPNRPQGGFFCKMAVVSPRTEAARWRAAGHPMLRRVEIDAAAPGAL